MTEDGTPSVNPDLDAMCELFKVIHNLQKRIKELEKENEGLIALINAERKRQEECDDIHLRKISDLEKENAGLKDKLKEKLEIEKNARGDWFGKAVTKDRRLTEAKDIIKKFIEFVNSENEYDPEHPEEYTKSWEELCKQAEQFLKES